MLQYQSKVEQTQPNYWPTLNKKGASVTFSGPATSLTNAAKCAAPQVSAKKLNQHFPNLLDTIEAEEKEQNDQAIMNQLLPSSSTTTKVDAMAKGSTKPIKCKGPTRKTKNKQTLLFSTEMNFKG